MSLFGNQQGANTGSSGGGLFGGASGGATGGGGLFGGGQQQQQQQNQGQQGAGATQNQNTGGGGLFGSLNAGKSQTPSSGGLFGAAGQNQQQQGQQQASTGGGLFGGGSNQQNQQQQQQPSASAGGGLFGKPASTQPQQSGSPFGGATNAQRQQQTSAGGGGLFGGGFGGGQQQQSTMGGSLLGGSTLVGNSSSSLFNQQPPSQDQPQNNQSVSGANQPSGAYFDSLFAKSKKEGDGDGALEDLPNLQLGLGDLRQRLRKLGSKPQDKPFDGRAHYLLAGSGVDPTTAARDLGSLDLQTGRVEKPYNYAPSEIDVETYLANLQSKTTMSMISDGLDRSARDFDSFLEDAMNEGWEVQRNRIYEHFGIKPREESVPRGAASARDSQSGFGRSRRSKAAPAGSRGGRQSVLGKSNMQRSVIGTPSKIGPHQAEFAEFADVERPSEGGRGADDRSLREKQGKLSEKIRNLNASRLVTHPYPILSELAQVESKSFDPHAPHIVEAYHAVREIVGEDPEADTTINGATAKERQFAQMYLDESANSANAIAMRKRLLEGANSFLEKQFLREVETLISKYPHEANLGGRPDIISKIRAYIRLRSARKDLVPDNTELQQVRGEYVWAVVFYLLRSGHVSDAAKFVNDQASAFRNVDRTFQAYLNGYASSEDRRLKRNLQDRCNAEYVQRVRNAPENSIDPFRMACYKIIGRCDLNNRNLEGLNTDINDWIWLQFNLAREGDRSVEVASEAYGLSELQSSIKEIGSKHFPKAAAASASEDASGSFGMFFYLQVLSGMFEEAIAYLYPFSYVDAVHFAIALSYYGLLRPSDPYSGASELRTLNSKDASQINFGRMIGYYTRDFRAADVVSAVDYLTLICLNMDLAGEAGRRNAGLCWEALRELVLETREFSKLIGDVRPDGQRIRGIIEERGPLVGLTDESDFVNTVTVQAANFAEENGRTTDAVLLYHLAGEYDMVVAIVSRALSEAVSLDIGQDPLKLVPVKPRAAAASPAQAQPQPGSSLSLASIDDPVELARTMMSMYERDAMFYRKIQDQNRVACRVLLELSAIKSLVEANQWAQCLDKIRSLEILPLEANGDPAIVRAHAAKFPSLAQPVAINVPNLLAWTVLACTRQRDQLSTGAFSGNEGTRRLIIEQMRQMVLDLTTYTAQLRYRFPPALHEALARAAAE